MARIDATACVSALWFHLPVPTWVTDLRDLPSGDLEGLPSPARHRVAFTRAVVEAATSRPLTTAWQSIVRCLGRVGRASCGAWVEVQHIAGERVEWSCRRCGDRGVVTNFSDTHVDLSRYAPRGKTVAWGFDEEERKLLTAATKATPELRAIIARARPHAEVVGLLLVEATVPELDAIYTLVETLAAAARSRSKIELLDGLRATLCDSMDGF